MDRFKGNSEEKNIQLIIQSDKSIWLPICVLGVYGAIILGSLYFQDIIYFSNKAYGDDAKRLAVIIISTIIVTYIAVKGMFFYGCAFGRTLVMRKDGCKVTFLIFHKFYTWNELAIKRVEDYDGMKYSGVRWSHTNPYKAGVFFSHKQVNKKSNMLPRNYCRSKKPWSTFFVNFYPYGLREDWKKVEDKLEINFLDILNFNTEYQRKREWELYPVDKELFFHYMDLWGVDIEGRSEETPPWKEFL